MSRQTDAYLAWCKQQGILHPPVMVANAHHDGWYKAVEYIIEEAQKQGAPLSGGTEQQRKDVITQDQYRLFERALQQGGYPWDEAYDICRTLLRIMAAEA